MSLALLFPLGLAALVAGLVPLLIHLVRREEQTPTDFAALRWLTARLKPRAKLRFEDFLLLVLRLLLITALALLLARPVLIGGAGDAPWLLVVPSADPDAAPAMPDGAQRRWLAPGFPALDTPRPGSTGSVSSLLRQLDAELPAATPVTVLVPNVITADGERPQLARTVDWHIAPLAGMAVSTPPAANDTLSFVVRHVPEREPALRYLRAAHQALRREGDTRALDSAGIDAPFADDTPALVWLAPGELPDRVREWIRTGGHLLIEAGTTWPLPDDGVATWRDADGRVIARSAALGRGRITRLQVALSPAELPALLDADFPARLREILEGPPAAPTLADAARHTPLAGGPGFPETPRELETPLLWLILALFALERGVATRRRPEPAA